MHRPMVFMPTGANIPEKWIARETDRSVTVVMPSRSVQGYVHEVCMQKDSRALSCSCPGFDFNGHCAHTAGLIWVCYKRSRKKGVQDTSIDAYHSFTADELEDRQLAVYKELLSGGPGSNNELAARLRWPINTITPRVGELREMGVVIEAGRQKSACNRTETIWMAIRWNQ